MEDNERASAVEPDRETLLVEYQKAQDSAEHHDNLVWTVSSIILGGMLVLMGFTLDHLTKGFDLLVLYTSILGIVLITFLWFLQSTLRSIKRQKYERCKIIEQKLGMEQHRKLEHPEGRQTKLYRIVLIVSVLFWVLIVLKLFCSC